MATFIWDLVDIGELNNYVRVYDNEVVQNQLVLDRFLPNNLVEDIEFRIRQGGFQDVDAAEYRSWDTQPRLGRRQGFTRLRGELPPVSRQIPLTEEESLRLRQMQRGIDGVDGGIVDQIYADLENMIRAVNIRVELARAQALYTGKVTIAENGLAIEVDWGVPAGNKVTPATVWSNVAATILTDLLAYQQLLVDQNGAGADVMLLSTQAFNYMLTNTEMKNAAAFAGTTPSRLTPDLVRQILTEYGLPQPVLYDAKFRVNGVQQRAIPADRVILLPDGAPVGETTWGVTAEATELVNRGLIARTAAPGIVGMVLGNDNPVQKFTLATAIALPVIGDPKSVFQIDAF